MAPLTMRVTVMATISSTMLKPLPCASGCPHSRGRRGRGHPLPVASGQPPSRLVQLRNVVNSALDRAPARAPRPSARTRTK